MGVIIGVTNDTKGIYNLYCQTQGSRFDVGNFLHWKTPIMPDDEA
jgi:hypothetical protein